MAEEMNVLSKEGEKMMRKKSTAMGSGLNMQAKTAAKIILSLDSLAAEASEARLSDMTNILDQIMYHFLFTYCHKYKNFESNLVKTIGGKRGNE